MKNLVLAMIVVCSLVSCEEGDVTPVERKQDGRTREIDEPVRVQNENPAGAPMADSLRRTRQKGTPG
ncbi:MAG: hypothetical protein WKF87_06605 [Chryseolinea sp.]